MKYNLINYCEIDKFASLSYSRIHNVDESLNLWDITKIDYDKLKDFDLLVGGSPCQSFSIAGKTEGAKYKCNKCGHEYNPLKIKYTKRKECPKCKSRELEGTTSSLIINYLEVINKKRPKMAIFENVKNLIGIKFKETFELFIKEIEEYGYNTYYKVLNAKDYGIPQNRERVIVVIIKKEIDNGKFKFPEPKYNNKVLKDFLEKDVDKKYYIRDELKIKLLNNLSDKIKESLFIPSQNIKNLGLLETKGFRQNRNVLGENGICTTITTMQGGNTQPKILSKIDLPICCASRGRNPENPNSRKSGLPTKQRLEINYNNTLNTLTTVSKDNYILDKLEKNEILDEFNPDEFILRKLTPLECFRLMGFSDDSFKKARFITKKEYESKKFRNVKKDKEKYILLSDSQAYKQAGNSIVVNVLLDIYKELYKVMPYLFEDLKIMSVFSGIGSFEKALDLL